YPCAAGANPLTCSQPFCPTYAKISLFSSMTCAMTTKATDPCQEIASFLKERSILKVLDEQVLWGVSLLMEELTFAAGDLIFEEGAASDSLYIVRSGTVEVQKGKRKPKPLAYLAAGECFGEIGVVQGTARGASVRVPEKATVLKLSKHALDELRR